MRPSWLGTVAAVAILAVCCGCGSKTNSTSASPTSDPFAEIQLATSLASQAAPLCAAAFNGAAGQGAAQAKLLWFVQPPGGSFEPLVEDAGSVSNIGIGLPDSLAATRPEEVHTLVCIQRQETQVGTYEVSGAAAMRTDYDVRLVRWPDGAVLAANSFRGSDPVQSRSISQNQNDVSKPVYGGDPIDALNAWLATVVEQPAQ